MHWASLALFAQNDDAAAAAAAGGIALVFMVIYFALIVAVIAGIWKVFEKAGKPGWAAIVPIYNIIVMLEISGKPVWWILLFMCPGVNIVIAIIMYIEIAKRFNQSVGFAVGMALLPFIFLPMLGFGSAQYAGEAGQLR